MIRHSIEVTKITVTRIIIDAPDIKTAIILAENDDGLIVCKEESISSEIKRTMPVTKNMIILDEISLMPY